MNPRRLAPILLPLLLLAACGPEKVPLPEGLDLRPRWTVGEEFEVREERRHLRGSGPFPATGEIPTRAEFEERTVDIYRETVISGSDTRLLRTRRRYLSSVRRSGGIAAPSLVAGRTYDISDPLGACEVRVLEDDGTRTLAPQAEVRRVRVTALRIIASLVPEDPVRVGATWRPGRDPSVLALRGEVRTNMLARLDAVEEPEGDRVAVVLCETDATIPAGNRVGARLALRETLRIDLERQRLSAYRSVTEWHYPRLPRRPEAWRRTVTEITITPL